MNDQQCSAADAAHADRLEKLAQAAGIEMMTPEDFLKTRRNRCAAALEMIDRWDAEDRASDREAFARGVEWAASECDKLWDAWKSAMNANIIAMWLRDRANWPKEPKAEPPPGRCDPINDPRNDMEPGEYPRPLTTAAEMWSAVLESLRNVQLRIAPPPDAAAIRKAARIEAMREARNHFPLETRAWDELDNLLKAAEAQP